MKSKDNLFTIAVNEEIRIKLKEQQKEVFKVIDENVDKLDLFKVRGYELKQALRERWKN